MGIWPYQKAVLVQKENGVVESETSKASAWRKTAPQRRNTSNKNDIEEAINNCNFKKSWDVIGSVDKWFEMLIFGGS